MIISARNALSTNESPHIYPYLLPVFIKRILYIIPEILNLQLNNQEVSITPKKCFAFVYKNICDLIQWNAEVIKNI